MPEQCLSPLCDNAIAPGGDNWRRTPKKFCSDQCKTNTWALRRTADLLCSLPIERKIEILGSVSSRNNQCEINGNNRCKITVGNEGEINMPKTYVCRSWPQLTIGKVRFRNGLFETSDPQLQRVVEKSHGFGVHIEEVKS
jgi:hypothetical protein